MKINFGCGRQVLDGFFNVDAVHSAKAPRAPELLHAVAFTSAGDVANPLPLAENPVRLAEELAMIDMISKGRLVSGFVRGGGQAAPARRGKRRRTRRRPGPAP